MASLTGPDDLKAEIIVTQENPDSSNPSNPNNPDVANKEEEKSGMIVTEIDTEIGTEIGQQIENLVAGAVQLLQPEPTIGELNAQKYLRSVQKARDKCPANAKRYLHQVHYIVNEKNQQEAFLGWSDDIPAVHVGHAVSVNGFGQNPLSLHTVAENIEDVQDSKRLDEEADPHKNHTHNQQSQLFHHQATSTTRSELLIPHSHLPSHSHDEKEREDYPKEILFTTNAFAKDKKGNFLFNESDRETFIKTKKRSLRRILFMDAKIKRVSDIDTTQETFRVKFHFYLTWLATYDEVQEYLKWEYQAEQRKKATARKIAPWTPEWEPQIEFTNAIDIHEFDRTSDYKLKRGDHKSFLLPESESSGLKKGDGYEGWGDYAWDIRYEQIGFDPRQGYWIRVKFDGDITFAEEFELESFPFDCQDLTLYLKVAEDSSSYCDLVPFPRTGEYLLLDPQFSVVSEWILEDVISEFGFSEPQRSKSLTTYAVVGIHIKASRIWRSHISTFIVTFCFFGLGLCIFSLTIKHDLGNRLAYSITLLLADVAALQLMFDKLPTIPYLTLLDIYMYLCFVYLFSAILWTGLAGGIESLEPYDFEIFILFICVFILLQATFFFGALISRQVERSKLTKTDAELHEVIRAKTFFGLCCTRQGQKSPISVLWNREKLLELDKVKDEKTLVGKGILVHETISRFGFY